MISIELENFGFLSMCNTFEMLFHISDQVSDYYSFENNENSSVVK